MIEFAVTCGLLIVVFIGIMDLGRYCAALMSLESLVGYAARSIVINCGSMPQASCATVTLTAADEQSLTPFLYVAGGSPTVTASASQGTITVTATLASFEFLAPVWSQLSGPLSATRKLYY
jgi:hypothetical protein